MVIIIAGLPGSGKSYFAERLAQRISGAYISTDRIRKEMLRSRTYSNQEKQAVYEEMVMRMRAAAIRKENIILDGTFYKEELRLHFKQALPPGIGVYLIEVVADEALIRERLQKPRADSDADYAVYQLIRLQWEPIQEPHLTLHSSRNNIGEMLQEAIHYISKDQ